MSDPYAEIQALRSRLRRIEEAAGVVASPKVWTSRELGDRPTYEANRNEIMQAAREGRIAESVEPEERPAPVYPPAIAPGLTPRGVDIFEATPNTPEEG
jgi:hypothetical protein